MRSPWLFSSLAFALCAAVVAWAQPVAPPAPPAPVPAPAEPEKEAPAVSTVRFPMFRATLDPHAARDADSFTACAALYDTLYTYEPGPSATLKPSLAESFPKVSEDGLTWTITLRKDARYHKSSIFEAKTRSVTAADVVTSFKRMSAFRENRGMYWLITGIITGLDEYGSGVTEAGTAGADGVPVEGLEAVDDQTVKFSLTRPFGGLLTYMAHPGSSIVPREAIEEWGEQLAYRAVGTGPYRLHAMAPLSIMVFKRNDAYWGEKPAYERVVLTSANDGSQLDEFNAGKMARLDMSPSLVSQLQPGGKPGPILANTGAQPHFFDQAGMQYLSFNMEDPVWGALDDDGRALRKAVSLALDRENLIVSAGFQKGWARPAHEPLAPGCEFGELLNEHSLGQHDAKAAKETLDASKYKGGIDPATGEALVLELLLMRTGERISYEQALRNALAAGLKPLGITVSAQFVEGSFDDYRGMVRGTTASAYTSGWFLDSPDAQNFLQLYWGENAGHDIEFENHARYKSPEFDKVYKQFEGTLPTPENAAKRRELVGQLLKQVAKDRPLCPLTVRKLCTLPSPKVEWPNEPAATYNELRRLKPAKAEGK